MQHRPTAILYTSHTGFTARYASMLARMSRIPAYDTNDIREHLPKGTAVIYLGWVCAGKIKGLGRARRQYDVRAVCAVGMAPEEGETMAHIRKENRLEEMPFFYLRGGYDHQKVKGIYRLMMNAMGKAMEKKAAQDARARLLLETMKKGANWVAPEALAPVEQWLNRQ